MLPTSDVITNKMALGWEIYEWAKRALAGLGGLGVLWPPSPPSGVLEGGVPYKNFWGFKHFQIGLKLVKVRLFFHCNSPGNSPRHLAIVEGFAQANSVFVVITSAKILLRWLFSSKIYIWFTIFNTYFSTKLLFTNRYHLHVLEKCLYVLQEVRSIIYLWQFIHPLSLCSRGNGTSFAFTSYIIELAKFCNVTFLNNFYFFSFFYHLFICRLQRKIRLVTLSKSYLYKIFF